MDDQSSYTQWRDILKHTLLKSLSFYGHMNWNNHYTLTIQIDSHNMWRSSLHFQHNNNKSSLMQGIMYITPSFQALQKNTCTRKTKWETMEAHLPTQVSRRPPTKLGETRHKWQHTPHSHAMNDHNNMTRFNTIHYTTSHPKALHKDSTIESNRG